MVVASFDEIDPARRQGKAATTNDFDQAEEIFAGAV